MKKRSLGHLEPRGLWEHFLGITSVPRCSGCEERVRNHVLEIAARNGLSFVTDAAGNVIVRKRPHPDMADSPGVVLQSHLDMVCEKNLDVSHDFATDPIEVVREGDWISADGTTLGADNGIGVAAMLALLEDRRLVHGPLEALFTVDEERGLHGASALEKGLLEGRILLNLDSEEEGALVIGCAGGADTFLEMPLERRDAAAPGVELELKVKGLRGGHSGIDIHLGRGNALKILAGALDALSGSIPFELIGIHGGDKHNAIPREARALLRLGKEEIGEIERARKVLDQVLGSARADYRATDPELEWALSPAAEPGLPLRSEQRQLLMDLLRILPHGVLAMSPAIPGLVETSTNLASVRTEDARVEIVASSRSARAAALEEVRGSLRALARVAALKIRQPEGYPGWLPDPESPLVARMTETYRDLFGTNPVIKALHAGLEPAVLAGKYENMRMISFGPEIRDPHSPREKVSIPSVERFWRLLTQALARMSALDG
ncbi:MAG: aminoacyl-histidine dipeptidase [bacterium]